MSNPEHAFQELARIFSSRGNEVLEIEIIPPSLGATFLQDGCSVGIAKKALVQAYTVARALFFKELKPMSENDFQEALVAKAQPANQDPAITEVMLLFDCEHLTACNWRKRRLCAAMAHSITQDLSSETTTTTELLEAELTLMSSYQCSPLHRHTKSPTLWHHRLWVLRHLLERRTWNAEAVLQLHQSELEVVLRAGELHPKNYYAFNYMRQLTALLVKRMTVDLDWNVEATISVVDRTFEWCLANPRDISGWSFGIYELSCVSDHAVQAHALEKVLTFALSVGWEGESLWTFVHQAVKQFDLGSVADDMGLHCPPGIASNSPPSSLHKQSWQTWLDQARVYWADNSQNDSS
ncbi:uncharacterized protein N7511_006602 [Penicillium nucicola]|uniref:uncharacterized protein n=1 Tax=Penicillium nucicola TaxID=1850975 RepID=UPI002545B2F5|nr:uncharacterized protein N7511_006602 [Penicillium nucicola]KAJ5757908.1 hypothetical protein N7511_006602 [Penicillium nucicola]